MTNFQGWKNTKRFFSSVLLATLLSGCHGIHSGTPHPFTTMFSYQNEPSPTTQLSLNDLRAPIAGTMPESKIAAADTATVY